MAKLIDLTGQRFGRLIVITRAENYVTPKGKKHSQYMCVCDCGNTIIVKGSSLKAGHTKSCGCLHKDHAIQQCAKNFTTHGLRRTRLYRIWRNMKTRCLNPNSRFYERYGGRGITVCEQWLNDFKSFYDWAMANGYREDLSIDRIDNDNGYNPENCRWASSKSQCNNRKTNNFVLIGNEKKTISEWCSITNLSRETVSWRLRHGWTPEEALGIVPRKK